MKNQNKLRISLKKDSRNGLKSISETLRAVFSIENFRVLLQKEFFQKNNLNTSPEGITNFIYLILLDPNEIFGSWLSLNGELHLLVLPFTLSRALDIEGAIPLCFDNASLLPPFAKTGAYTPGIAAIKPGAAIFISIDMKEYMGKAESCPGRPAGRPYESKTRHWRVLRGHGMPCPYRYFVDNNVGVIPCGYPVQAGKAMEVAPIIIFDNDFYILFAATTSFTTQ